MEKTRQKILLAVLIIILISVNYSFLDKKITGFLLEGETGKVERVIDGDTIVLEDDEHVRLLGINTPEKGEPYSSESKAFLESMVLNRTVQLRFGKEQTDLYGRTLAYIFLGSKNVNLEMVEEGLANYYFPSGKDTYYEGFADAWGNCIDKNVNLCKKSGNLCSGCVEIRDFIVKSQKFTIYNKCDFSCNLAGWSVKDEGRKQFSFPEFSLHPYSGVTLTVSNGTNTNSELFWQGESYVWTESGDTLFLRDDEGELVLWESY